MRAQQIPDAIPVSQEEGLRRFDAFRFQRLEGDFVFRFRLVHFPRQAKSFAREGLLLGTWTENGPMSRLILYGEGGDNARPALQLLLHGGRVQRVWLQVADGEVERIDSARFLEPLLSPFDYSVFDVLMPFVWWEDVRYEKSERLRGRSTHRFLARPDEATAELWPSVGSVGMALDAGYNALISVEIARPDGGRLRTMEILNFRKVSEQWIVRSIDFIQHERREKTRFTVVGAAVGLELPSAYFTPEGLQGVPPQDASFLLEMF